MNGKELNQTMIGVFWGNSCQSAQTHAIAMSNNCSQPFRELIHQETQKFISQNPPTTNAELQELTSKGIALSSKISSIFHANYMASSHPKVATEIYNATKSFCGKYPLSSNTIIPGIELSNQINQICHSGELGQ